jgi:hypothetical protein
MADKSAGGKTPPSKTVNTAKPTGGGKPAPAKGGGKGK